MSTRPHDDNQALPHSGGFVQLPRKTAGGFSRQSTLFSLQPGQRLLRLSRQLRQARLSRFSNDVDVYAVVGMPQSVPHSTNIAPGLARHEFLGARA